MILITVILAIALLQFWVNNNPFHKDTWFFEFIEKLKARWPNNERSVFIVAVGVPAIAVTLAYYLAAMVSPWLSVPIGVAVLLFSFGRGEFNGIVNEYTNACQMDNWGIGISRAKSLGVETQGLKENDWDALHLHVLDEAVYRGFERMFVVLFCFFVLGPVAAILYRLIFLYHERFVRCAENTEQDQPEILPQFRSLSARLLWLIEWPIVRVMGFSMALTGNFAGCYHHWRNCLACAKRTSKTVLSEMVLGALTLDESTPQTCDVTQRELRLVERLYSRTLWLWLAAGAIIVIFVH